MFTKNTLKSTLGLIVTSLILSACGGGEGGGDNTPPARNTGSISGNVFDAPVSGAKIEVFEYKDGNLGRKLASTTSDAFGDYKVEFESSSMPLFIVAKEGSYTDPLTKNTVSVSNGKTLRLEAMLNYKEGRDQNLMLTPLTNIVSGLTQYKVGRGVSDSTAISESLNSINDMYGFDVNETTPIDITKGGQSSFATSGHQYGALLTAYSSYSYDLIQKYGDTQSNIYTSMHLADIQYRDVIADGLLDGLEISTVSGGVTPLTFGQQKVSSDIYTNDLAQHVLIVVNDPNLNISGTDADDYVEFSRKINDQGTNSGTGGVIPPRDETEIDTEAPTVFRTDSDVLAGLDKVDIKLNDEIGVQGVSAYLEYQLDGVWSLESQCDDEQTSDSEFCFLEFDGFESGLRETSIKVGVDTKAIDAVEVGLSNVTAARLVFYTTDVLGNELVQGRDVGQYINFEWDNNAPVIEVTSEDTFNGKDDNYFLRGIIKEDYQNIESTTVRINGELPKNLECKPMNAEFGSACSFEESYPAADFSSSTTSFEITATDTQGNVGIEPHTVTKDDQAPEQVISYPKNAPMNYINVSVDGERVSKEDVYTQDTYTSETVQSTRDYLKIDYIYASKGILSSIPGVDFSDFNVNHLKDNKIPYVRVRVSDGNGDTGLGSSADKLKLVVKYLVSPNNDNNYALQKVTDTVASAAKIPHETISDTEGHVNEVIYYVPFVKEILGDNFDSTSENSSQKLVIQTIDESENESAEQEVYFRSSFDLPTMTIVTPFIGASVQLEGLNSKGEFTSLGRCTTIQHLESDGTNKALDVAGCETTTDVVNYDFMRVRLIGIDGNTQPHYYKWESDPGTQSEQVNLNSANIGAYFKLNGSKTFYITELATYQTGLFDSQWNQVEAGNKTPENAARILDDVEYALAGGSDSFFGFDPTIVSYATNEMLKGAIPEKLPNNYIHRFLVEAIYDITQVNNMLLSNSVDFASAIYDDLQYDGQANGIGSGGKKIVLDSYEFSSKSYRNDLAQSYYNIMTEKYGVTANLAQRYADQISMANPSLDGEQIIDGDVESIDKSPPQPSLSIENGRETWVGNKRYVAGVLNSQILLEDPSGIVVEEGSQPSFVTMWYEKTEPNTGTPIDLNIRESGGDSYKKEYLFTLDTESSNLTGIDKFELITSAMDEHGNSYGYNGEDPHIETLYIDNDYPLVTYTPPIGGDDNPVEEGVYLNTNYNQELTFTIDDPVGDKLDKRGLTFYNAATGESNSYAPNRFSSNEEKYFKVKLCSGEKCSAEDNILSPKDGNWTVYVSAEDNLSNIVNRQTTNAPQFSVLLDSKGPVVNGSKIANHLGGNSSWVPDITWSLSPGSLVKVEMKPESGRRFTLQQYETEPEESAEPYLFGIQPNVEVRLVADAFKYNEKNFFYVTATDSSFPLGTHSGEFEFLVDNKGPVIELADPWVIDTNSGESYVLGTNFTVKITSVSDDSDVSKVELWQQGQATAIRSIDPKDPTQPFDIVITETQSDAIVIGEDKKANLYLKAVDEYGFESETEIRTILLDREGPSLKLNGFDPESFYLGNYVFNLSAQDLNDRGTPSSEGVNKETLEYWTFKENPSDASTLVGDEMKIPLGGENYVDSATRTIRLGGSDIRGNTTSVDYVVKVQNSKPTIKSVTFTYEGGTPVSSAGGQIQITRSEPVIISIAAEDESGIPLVEGTYKYGEQTNNISFSQKDGLWEARLTEADLTEDGAYQLEFKVYNNVRYNSEQERPSATRSASINVQRQGVALSIAKPTDFQSHISGSTLNVEFDPVGEVKARTLECWVRENYTSEGVPEDGPNYAYSGVITNPQENYKCSVTTDVNMSVSPVVLITKTVGTNGTETVNKFSFNMMDIDVPTVEQDTYQFTGNDVGLNDKGEKILSLTLSFKDNLSGLDISDGNEPLLVRNRLNVSFEPKSCSSKLGITTCTYTELYADILYPGALQHLYTIKNLSDIAGNLGSDHALELLLPARGDLEIAITSPAENTFIRGETLEMNFKVKVGQNDDLENIVVTLDDASYNLNDNPENFSPSFIKCEDDYSCSTFTAPLGDKLDGKKIEPRIQIIDVWGESKSDEVRVTVDNSVPNIDDTVTLNESPDDANLVRFQFSVWDEGSGIASVKYTLSNPKHVFDKDNIPDNSHLYFDLPKTELQGLNSIRVNVEATDNVGWTQNKTIDIDIRVPTIDLAFDGITSLQGDKLAFTNESQAFTITSDEGEDVKAASYSIDLVPASGSTIKFSGKIASSTASDTMTFDIDAQAEYMQKVTVTDSIGRVITDVNVLNKTYDSKGIASIVDYQAPVISSITSTQDSMIPEEGQYYLDVRAYVFDKNLSSVNSTANNGTDAPVNPQLIEEPIKDGDPYLIRYLLSPGDYLITVTADDLVKHKTEKSLNTKVEAASIPELTISTAASMPLAGGVEIPLLFTFTEEVNQFEFSDVEIKADDDNDIGALKEASWSTTDNITWTVNYIAPEKQDKNITIRVGDNSYESVNTIPGTGGSLVMGVEGVLPTLTKVTFDPTYQEIGKDVQVELKFDKELQEAKATLGANNITMIADTENKKVWTGTVKVPNVPDLGVGLVVSQYKDLVGNVGEDNTSYELPITPTLTVEAISDVNGEGVANVTVSGGSKRFEIGDSFTIKARDSEGSEVTVNPNPNPNADGDWSSKLDVSGLKDGTIRVTVNGTNKLNAPAAEAETTFTLTQTKPTVDDSQTSINPTHAAAGESVTVTATFDKGVTTPTGSTLGTAAINWTAQSGTQTQWVGTAEVASVADSVKSVALTLQGFSDATGNTGEAFTSSKALAMTPTLTVEAISDVNEAGAASVAVSGNSTRFETTDTLTIKAVDTDNKEVTQTTTVAALGKWNATLDVSGLKDGTIAVTVNGTNDLEAPAKEAGTTFTLTQTKPTVDDSQTSINPTHAAAGESVTITATFDKGVTTPTGSALGTAAINWTAQSGTQTQWVGTAEVASVADSVKSVALTLQGFSDATGNTGEAFTSSKALAMTPTLTVEAISDVNEAGAASVAVSGNSTRFETTDTLTIKAVDTDNKEVTQTTTVAALGKWNATLDVSGLKDGTIAVTVNGTNDLEAPAKEAGTTFTLTQTKPTVDDSQTSINPTHAAAGESVTITATFDKGVTTPTGSTLGTAAINWTAQSGTQTQWVGTAEVASVADSVKSVALTLQGFSDATGNTGEAFTSSKALAMTPTLTVEAISDVNEAGAASVAVSGNSTRFETTDTLTIKAVDTDNKEVTQTTTVAALGKWNATLDVSGLKDGTIAVTVNGTNDLEAPAKEAGTTFTLTQTKPTVDDSQTSINPTHAAAGESVTITATFDKGVTTPTGSALGTAAINWTAQSGTQTQWVGTAEVASVADSVKSVALTLQGFSDATGNTGEAFTSSKALAMTPTLTVEAISDVNEAGAASVAVSGNSTRFETTDTLTIKAVDTDNKEVTQTTTVAALGKWNATLDVSGLKDGTIAVTVNGTNDLEAPAKEAGTTFTLTQTKPTVDDSQTSINPTHAAAGESVTITATFDKGVTTPTGSALGTAAINWTAQSGTQTQWVGTAEVASVADSVKSVALTLQGFSDATGNTGEAFTSSKALAMTPTLTVEAISDVNEAGAASVAVSGNSTRFETTDTLTIKAVDTDNKEVTQTTTVAALGKWNATLDVSGLKDGTIAVTVNGTNDLEAPAKEAGTTFTLTQTKPTVDDSQTSINPTHAAAGESVTITATFDKGVTTPTGSTLGTAAINWTAQSGTQTQWVGTAEVASVADSVKSVALTLQGFSDATGNTGEAFTSSKALAMTPTLTVEAISDVNEAGAASVAVSGNSTRFETTDTLTIKAVDTDNKEVTQTTTVAALGKWNATLDVSGLKDGTIAVTVNGTNDLEAPAKEAGTTFTLTQTKPTVDDSQTSINPTHAAAGESVTITATFDKGVTTPTGSALGTAAINWTAQSGTQTQWVGTAEVASVADSVKSVALTLQGFSDATGNTGEAFTSSKALAMTPTLTVEAISDVNEAGAASVAVSGNSTRFETTDTLTIKAVDTDNKEVTQTTTVAALGKWNATLDVSGLKDGTIAVTVNGTNDLEAPAKEAGTTFTLTQTKPTVDDSQTSINPTHAAAGESVTITATFDKGVTTPTGSTLGTAAINWTAQSGTQTQWVGTAEVASVADSVKSVALTLQGFSDATGNTGEAFTSSKALAMTPTLTVEAISDVNEAGAASVAVSGNSTRFETTDTLTIKAVDTDNKEVTQTTTVAALGKWNATLDVSGLKDGTIAVTVNGTNDLEAPAKEAGTTFTLTQTKPTVDDSQTSINPTHAAAGESVTITATFDKGVTTPTGSALGTAAINWTAQSGTQTQWVGTAEVASVADSVKSVALTLQGFSDATGNTGEAFTSSKALAMTPTLTVEAISDVNEAGAASVAVSGNSTRFETTDTLTIKAVDTDNKEVTQTTTVAALGKWNATLDVSGLKDGTIAVTVNGTNDLEAPAKEAGTTFTLTQTKPTVDDSQTSINPTHAAAGESVTITATFDKGVTTPTGSTLGTAAINWTAQSGTQTQWVGTAEVASVADSVKSVALTLQGFSDATGNTGEAFTSSKALAMTPTLTVEAISDVNEAGAASVAVSGNSTRFETTDTLTIKAVDTDNKEVTQTTTVAALGKWNATLDVSGLKDGTIAVTVNGTNDLEAPAKEAGTTFTLTQTKPTVDDSQTSINPTHAAAGESVTITATFDKGVTTPTGSALGTAAINWTAQSGTQTQWVGTAEVASVADSVKSVALTLQGFSDATGNTGVEYTLDNALAITPTIAFETINDVTGPTKVTINGTTTRFEEWDSIALKAIDTDSLKVLGSATVLADGTWTVDLDLSTLKDGDITVYANGTNSLSAPADEVSTTFNYSSTTALVVPNYWESDSAELPSQKAA
ncbi:tandem large repeat [Vibrio lentus]|uniref:tandem large repeat n=6 Tax=Vibrio lentus TaxID=136468 RepID=UPI001D0485F0|nr:tandem large repeat [Vibrio lentus]